MSLFLASPVGVALLYWRRGGPDKSPLIAIDSAKSGGIRLHFRMSDIVEIAWTHFCRTRSRCGQKPQIYR